MTVQDIILKYLLEKNCYVAGGTIEREASTQNKPGTINRELRRMSSSEFRLIKQNGKGKYLTYGVNSLEGGFYHDGKRLIPADDLVATFDKSMAYARVIMTDKDHQDYLEAYANATQL